MTATQSPPIQPTATDFLFGDLPLSYWASMGNEDIPWTLFRQADECVRRDDLENAFAALKNITKIPALDSRQYLQAFSGIREMGISMVVKPTVHGIVAEVGMPEGTDTVAVYADYSARYYNYTGAGVVWEHADGSLDQLTMRLMELATDLVTKIGPWQGERRPAPANNIARINILTANGLYFGEAPIEVLFGDAMSKGLMNGMFQLMQALMKKGTNGRS